MDDDRSANKRLRQEKRNEVIGKYKEISRQLQSMNLTEDSETLQRLIKENLGKLTELYPVVKKKLEGTSVDSKVLKQLVALCLESANRINRTTRPFDMRRVIRGLMKDFEGEASGRTSSRNDFFKYLVEDHVNTFLCNPPSLEFMYGTLRSEGLEPRVKRRRLREKIVENKSVTAKQKNIELEVDEDSTPKEVEFICSRLSEIATDKPNGVPFFQTIVDPNSFTQTVENIFHVSFLVKEGKIGVKSDKTAGPVLYLDSNNAASQDPDQPTTSRRRQEMGRNANTEADGNHQSILSFSMDDYKDWISRYNVRSNLLSSHSR